MRSRRLAVVLLACLSATGSARADEPGTTTIVPPYLRWSDAGGSTETVLPLYFRWSDKLRQSSTSLLFPLAIWHSAPTENGFLLGPFYSYHDAKGGYGGMFPLFMGGDRGGRAHLAVLPPLFVHVEDRNAGTATTVVGPGFGHTQPDGWDGGLAPLVFAGRHDDRRYFSFAGLYTYRSTAHRTTHVLGPIYASSGDDGYDYGLAPLVHIGASPDGHTSWVLPPLWIHWDHRDPGGAASSFTSIGPLFSTHEANGDATRGLFPLVWDAQRGRRHYTLVLPLGGHVRDDEAQTSTLVAGPFVRWRDDKARSSTTALVPLFFRHDDPTMSATVAFPIYWDVTEGAERTTAVFPLWLHAHRADLDANVVFPLWWDFRTDKSTTRVAATAYWRTGPHRFDAGLAPLGGWGHGDGTSYAWALPLLFWHSSDEHAGTNRTVLANFLFDRDKDDWTSWLLPAYYAARRSGETRFYGPAIYHRASDEAKTDFTLVGPFYYGHEPATRYGGILPLLYGRSSEDGTWSATLLPLFSATRKRDGLRLLTPAGGFSTGETGWRGYLGDLYVRRDKDVSSQALVPLFYHGVDHSDGSVTSYLFPLYLYRHTRDATLTAITPLVWHYSTVESSFTLGLPVWFDADNHYTYRSYGLLPLFVRHRDEVADATSWVFPLLYVHDEPHRHDWSFFPLVWRFADDTGHTSTAVFPLYWDIRRGGSTTTVMFPFFMHAHRDTADHWLVLNTYYRSGHGIEAGSWAFNFFPLFDVARPSAGDLEWNFLEGLFGYQRVGHIRKVKLLYMLDVPLDSSPSPTAAAGEWFGATSPASRLANF